MSQREYRVGSKLAYACVPPKPGGTSRIVIQTFAGEIAYFRREPHSPRPQHVAPTCILARRHKRIRLVENRESEPVRNGLASE